MKLSVPLVLQEKDSVDCGLAGVAMLLQYYAIPATVDDLREDLVTDTTGTYAPQLGEYLMRKGFIVEIVTMHPKLFTLSDEGMTQEQVLVRLKGVLEKSKDEQNKKTLKAFITFMQQGGFVRVAVPNKKIVEEEIKNNRPLGALLTSNFLSHNEPIVNFHFNIITGIDDMFIYANDPLWDVRGGKKQYPIDAFFYGVAASVLGDLDNASLILVKKKE